MARDRIRPEDVEALYGKRLSIKTGVTSAEPEMDRQVVRLATGKTEDAYNHHDIQFAADAHDEPRYSNDVADDWRRGAGDGLSDGRKPAFDFGGSWRRKNKGDDWSK